MKTAAVLPALGIGDALLMMIASLQLKNEGYRVTTFHHALPELSPWFPNQEIAYLPEDLIEKLSSFDLILAENDNSEKIRLLKKHYRDRLAIFYPTYSLNKHGPTTPLDRIFNPLLPMADNIAHAVGSPSKENGLTPPAHLVYKQSPQCVLIHPTSRVATKNWLPKGFLTTARALKERGMSPLFCVGPQEKQEWRFVENEGFTLATPASLTELATLIYASGALIGNDSLAGHLASNLNIPTLIIADDRQRMQLWRPSWKPGNIVFPYAWLPDCKLLRTHWQHFISPKRVLKHFENLLSAPKC